MALQHAGFLEVVTLATPEPIGSTSTSSSLLRTAQLQVLRLVLARGGQLPTHQLDGEMTIQCLSGNASLIASEGEFALEAGQLMALAGHHPHAVRANEPSVLLVTLVRTGTAA